MGESTSTEVRYLELLKRALTRTLDESVPQVVSPSTRLFRRVFRLIDRKVLAPRQLMVVRQSDDGHQRRAEGHDLPVDAETMIGLRRLDNLQECIETVIRDEIPGDVLEAGVWRGGATIFMEAVLTVHGATDRTLWVCDSFAGLPKPNPDLYPADRGDEFWTDRYLAVPADQVRRNFERYDLLEDNVRFVEGLFQETLPSLPADRIAVLRADGDMYESTIAILDNLYDKVSEGGFVIIDDYGAVEACRLAVDEFRTRRSIVDPLVQIDWTGYFWRKGVTEEHRGNPASMRPASVP